MAKRVISMFKSLEMSKTVFCVMQNRYSPPSVWLKEIIDNNVLGDIFMVKLDCYWNRDDRYYKKGNWHGDAKLDGGTLFTQFSHFIDIMPFGCFSNIHRMKISAFKENVSGGFGNSRIEPAENSTDTHWFFSITNHQIILMTLAGTSPTGTRAA